MQTSLTLKRTIQPAFPAQDCGVSPAGRMLLHVFEALERSGIRYCVLHGYEDFPRHIRSDVDCIVDRGVSENELNALLQESAAHISARVARRTGSYFVLASREPGGSHTFLALDFAADSGVRRSTFHKGEDVLNSRRRRDGYWIPAAGIAFGSYLTRTIAKGRLDDARAERLRRLFSEDAAACEQQVSSFWTRPSADLITSAARTGDWAAVRAKQDHLGKELRRRAALRSPVGLASKLISAQVGRLRRAVRPDGVSIVLLGPDGAGKSSLIDALGTDLSSVFPRTVSWGFAPPLSRLLGRRPERTDQPHALPPRTMSASLIRAGYWLAFHAIGYVGLRVALARSTLVLYDRHFLDILVDPTRYRYGGPMWLVRMLWRLIPKPDLILLLDAPPEVLQARKQEVPFAVTARQRQAYSALVRTLANGRVINAAQPLEAVANDAIEIILDGCAARIAPPSAEAYGAPLAADHASECGRLLDLTSMREKPRLDHRPETEPASPGQSPSTS